MNILILSCGTRNKLVQYFLERKNGFDRVIATDCSICAPALYEADNYYIVPRMKENGYLDVLEEICENESINAILPLHEEELLLITQNKKIFEDKGIKVLTSTYETVELCRDKYLFFHKLSQSGIKTIKTILFEEFETANINFPVFVKPRRGAGSVGSIKINTLDFLKAYIKDTEEEVVIQPYVEAKEYGVDAYVDYITGELVSIFIKEKLRMRAGETEKSISVVDTEIEDVVKKMVKELDLKGPIDIDILKNETGYYVLEVNPRFGGGYPHAYECGVNFPKLISTNVAGACNIEQLGKYEQGVLALKYSEVVIKDEKKSGYI